MRSRSLLPLVACIGVLEGPDTRSPKLLASAESRLENALLPAAQREFLRMTDVTEEISEKRMCRAETATGMPTSFAGMTSRRV
jgi:hypothetical protein